MAACGGYVNGPNQSNQLIDVQSIKALLLIQSHDDQLSVINTVKVNVKRKVPSGIGGGFVWACPINLRRHKSVHPDRSMSGNTTRPTSVDGRHDGQRTPVSSSIVLGDTHRTSLFEEFREAALVAFVQQKAQHLLGVRIQRPQGSAIPSVQRGRSSRSITVDMPRCPG